MLISEIERKRIPAIGHLIIYVILVGVFTFAQILFHQLANSFGDSGMDGSYPYLLSFQFLLTTPLYGYQTRILVIASFAIVAVGIFLFSSSKAVMGFYVEDNQLVKRVKSGLMSNSKSYNINEIDYLRMHSKTTITTNAATANSYGGTSVYTTHFLEAVYDGVRVKTEKILVHKDLAVLESVANKISKATGIPLEG